MTNHYETLGVSKDATQAEIKKAYRRKTRENHPDVNDTTSDDMAAINVAYEVLSDAERRKNYDETGRDNVAPYMQMAKATVVQKTLHWLQTQDEKGDLITFLTNDLNNDMNNVLENKKRGEAIIAKLKNALSRVIYEGDEKDIITEALENQIKHIENQLSSVEGDITKINIALKIVHSYKYRTDMIQFSNLRQLYFNGITFNRLG